MVTTTMAVTMTIMIITTTAIMTIMTMAAWVGPAPN